MKYERLVDLIHYQTWVEREQIKRVLEVMTDVLRNNHEEGDYTRTPLGVFCTHVRPGKEWVLPDGSPTQIPERTQVQLRPSARMTKGWEPKKANLNKLVRRRIEKPAWNPVKLLLDEDDELLEEDD